MVNDITLHLVLEKNDYYLLRVLSLNENSTKLITQKRMLILKTNRLKQFWWDERTPKKLSCELMRGES